MATRCCSLTASSTTTTPRNASTIQFVTGEPGIRNELARTVPARHAAPVAQVGDNDHPQVHSVPTVATLVMYVNASSGTR